MNPLRSPQLLTVTETAELLRTTPKAIYAMVERQQLVGVRRLRRRVLIDRSELLDSLRPQPRVVAEGIER
jgi:excisionase family DNA binding protein